MQLGSTRRSVPCTQAHKFNTRTGTLHAACAHARSKPSQAARPAGGAQLQSSLVALHCVGVEEWLLVHEGAECLLADARLLGREARALVANCRPGQHTAAAASGSIHPSIGTQRGPRRGRAGHATIRYDSGGGCTCCCQHGRALHWMMSPGAHSPVHPPTLGKYAFYARRYAVMH